MTRAAQPQLSHHLEAEILISSYVPLRRSQRQALNFPQNHLYVSGPAGCGKKSFVRGLQSQDGSGKPWVWTKGFYLRGLCEMEGLLRQAQGGHLVVEDIGQMSDPLVVCLLERLSGVRLVGIGVLAPHVCFWRDFFNVWVHMPSLAERPQDKSALAQCLLRSWGVAVRINEGALDWFIRTDLPGEGDQISWLLEQAVASCWKLGKAQIHEDLLEELYHSVSAQSVSTHTARCRLERWAQEQLYEFVLHFGLKNSLKYIEHAWIEKTMTASHVVGIRHAAELLQMPSSTLFSRMRDTSTGYTKGGKKPKAS
jgi:DNA-binding NtrC family response regulator